MWQRAGTAKPISAEQASRFLSKRDVSLITLRRILYRAPEPYKKIAWKELALRENPNNLRGVLYSAPREYRLKVADLMFENGVAYKAILNKGLVESRRKVANFILNQISVSVEDLKLLILRAPEPYRSRAWREFMKSDLPSGKSSFLRRHLHSFKKQFRNEAEEYLRSKR